VSVIALKQIFVDDVDEVKALPRDQVLNYLERTNKALLIPYLVRKNRTDGQ
jgi:hypothetical protein